MLITYIDSLTNFVHVEWTQELLQENVADLLEETAECDVLILSVVYDYLIMCVGASFCFLSMLSSRAHE